MKQQELLGQGCCPKLSTLIAKPHPKALFFCSKSVLANFKERIDEITEDLELYLITDLQPNPDLSKVRKLSEELKDQSFDVCVALGGGSVIDFAKALKHVQKSPMPIIAIPTTAGSGAEATHFAVAYENAVKTSLADLKLLPQIAIVDSSFLKGSPQRLKACTALDAMCQAIESLWSNQSSFQSEEFAAKALTLCRAYIKDFVLTEDPAAASKMSLAAHLSGKAINISRTTAPHALSYYLTSKHGLPHGHAVAISLPDVLNAALKVDESTLNDPRGIGHVLKRVDKILTILGLGSAEEFASYWHILLSSFDLAPTLKSLDFKVDIDAMLSAVNYERMKNTPVRLDKALPGFYQD